MGKPEHGGATDSWGRLHGYRNIQVNDSSLLPETPGINPQGLILAIANRNLAHFLG
jgi:choline dehydrogenase-like flavoprotein